MSKRRKHDELWLLNLANNMIGKTGLSARDLHLSTSITDLVSPEQFLESLWHKKGPGLYYMVSGMTACKLGQVINLALGSNTRSRSENGCMANHFLYRIFVVADIYSEQEWMDLRVHSENLLSKLATDVIAGAMYEILVAEQCIILGDQAINRYTPTDKMIEFVKKTRIKK